MFHRLFTLAISKGIAIGHKTFFLVNDYVHWTHLLWYLVSYFIQIFSVHGSFSIEVTITPGPAAKALFRI